MGPGTQLASRHGGANEDAVLAPDAGNNVQHNKRNICGSVADAALNLLPHKDSPQQGVSRRTGPSQGKEAGAQSSFRAEPS